MGWGVFSLIVFVIWVLWIVREAFYGRWEE